MILTRAEADRMKRSELFKFLRKFPQMRNKAELEFRAHQRKTEEFLYQRRVEEYARKRRINTGTSGT